MVKSSEDGAFPHGAVGLEIAGLIFKPLPDGKLILIPRSEGGSHYTFHPGSRSGIMDIHRTLVGSDGAVQHESARRSSEYATRTSRDSLQTSREW
jgi:hypothetical protein